MKTCRVRAEAGLRQRLLWEAVPTTGPGGIREAKAPGWVSQAQGWESLEVRQPLCCPHPQAGRCRPGLACPGHTASFRRPRGAGSILEEEPWSHPERWPRVTPRFALQYAVYSQASTISIIPGWQWRQMGLYLKMRQMLRKTVNEECSPGKKRQSSAGQASVETCL